MRSVVILLFLSFSNLFPTAVAAPWWKRLSARGKTSEESMGQAVRVMKYDRTANERAALSALHLAGSELKWFRLDDGVMGGQSETNHVSTETGELHFAGTINTDGGGFCSIRAKLPEGFGDGVAGIKLKILGDGKTYKLTLSDGNSSTGGPFSRSPSWQVDLPTKGGEEEDVVVYFNALKPAFGGRSAGRPTAEETSKYTFDAATVRELGLMLSLRLSDGSPNPKETFGEGIFPFSLKVKSIEAVQNSKEDS